MLTFSGGNALQGIGQHGRSRLSPGAEAALAASFQLLVGDPGSRTTFLSREAWEAQSGSRGGRAPATLLLSQLPMWSHSPM